MIDLDGAEPTWPSLPKDAIKFRIVNNVVVVATAIDPNTKMVVKYKFNYVETQDNTFSNADVWRMRKLFSINYLVRGTLKAQSADPDNYQDGNRFTKGLCSYDCITTVIESSKLLYNRENIPGNGESMQGWLKEMAVAGLAGKEYTVGFLNANNQSANDASTAPSIYSAGTTFTKKLNNISKAEGNANVFGVSLFGGYHSFIVTKERNGNFTLHDEYYWGVKTFTAKALDQHILNEAKRLQKIKLKNGTLWKDHNNLEIKIRALKPQQSQQP